MVKTNITATRNGSRAISYAINDNYDPHDKNDPLITHRVLMSSSVNCSLRNSTKQMGSIWYKLKATKRKRIQAYRVIQSFDLSELDPHKPADIQMANKIGVELAKKLYPERQCVVATQADGVGHKLHNHIVINAIDYKTMKSLKGNSRYQPYIAKVSDEIVESHGITLANDKVTDGTKKLTPRKRRKISDKKVEEKLHADHQLTFKETLISHIDKARQDPDIIDFETLKRVFSERYNVNVRITKSKKRIGLSYKLINENDDPENPMHYHGKARGQRLGSDYMVDAYTAIFEKNKALLKQRQADQQRNSHNISVRLASVHAEMEKSAQATSQASSSSYNMFDPNSFFRQLDSMTESRATQSKSVASSQSASYQPSRVSSSSFAKSEIVSDNSEQSSSAINYRKNIRLNQTSQENAPQQHLKRVVPTKTNFMKNRYIYDLKPSFFERFFNRLVQFAKRILNRLSPLKVKSGKGYKHSKVAEKDDELEF